MARQSATVLPRFSSRLAYVLAAAGINHVVLPIGALGSAHFAGRLLSRQATMAELGLGDGPLYRAWRFAVRWLTPALIIALFAANLLP